VLPIAALASSLLGLTFVVVPLDDRPVTAGLPRLPRRDRRRPGRRAAATACSGANLTGGDPAAILRWLRDAAPPDARAYVVSTDMAVYGGLVASRVPGVSRAVAYTRISDLAAFRAGRPGSSFSVFGTVMRLARPAYRREVPAAAFPFAGDLWPALQEYANLPDPPRREADRARAESAAPRSSAVARRLPCGARP